MNSLQPAPSRILRPSSGRIWSWCAFLVLSAVCLPACREKKRTEIVLGIATDLNAPLPLSSVRLELFRHPEGVLVAQQDIMVSGNTVEPYELPGSYGVYSADGTPDRFRVVLHGIDNLGRKTVTRTAVLTLVPEKTLFVRLGVVTACLGKSDCAVGDTCIEGRCAPEEIDSARLPAYVPGMEKRAACAGDTVFMNTSSKQPIPVDPVGAGGVACDKGTCQEGTCLAAVEGTFTPATSPMAVGRTSALSAGTPLASLSNGTVLLMGGVGTDKTSVLSVAEIYNPQSGTFSPTGSMSTSRAYFAQAELPDGRVLVMGGMDGAAQALPSAELYDPTTGTFAPAAGPMGTARVFPSAVTLSDGRVLVLGGTGAVDSFVAGQVTYSTVLDSAEIYDPGSGLFSPVAGRLLAGRASPNVFALPGGGAVVLGGQSPVAAPVATIERFDTTRGTFDGAPLATVPSGLGCSAAELGGGKLLVLSTASTAAWVFDLATATFLQAGPQPTPEAQLAAVLSNGDVLFAGGAAGRRAYLFDAATRSFAYVVGDLGVVRSGFSSARLANGDVLIAGGDDAGTAELFRRRSMTAGVPVRDGGVADRGGGATGGRSVTPGADAGGGVDGAVGGAVDGAVGGAVGDGSTGPGGHGGGVAAGGGGGGMAGTGGSAGQGGAGGRGGVAASGGSGGTSASGGAGAGGAAGGTGGASPVSGGSGGGITAGTGGIGAPGGSGGSGALGGSGSGGTVGSGGSGGALGGGGVFGSGGSFGGGGIFGSGGAFGSGGFFGAGGSVGGGGASGSGGFGGTGGTLTTGRAPGIYVTQATNEVKVFSLDASGNVPPSRVIAGRSTGLSLPLGLAVDSKGNLYVANRLGGTVTVYPAGATGDVLPTRTIKAATLWSPSGVAVGATDDLYVSSCPGCGTSMGGEPGIYHFPTGASVPDRIILRGNFSGLSNPSSIALDEGQNLVVANSLGGNVATFAPGASGDAVPLRSFTLPIGSNVQSLAYGARTLFIGLPASGLGLFPAGVTGAGTAASTIGQPNPPLSYPGGVFVDTTEAPPIIYLADYRASAIYIIRTAGTPPVLQATSVVTIGGDVTTLNQPVGVHVVK